MFWRPVPNAPRHSINMLARDHISVAAPVLAESPRLTDSDLVDIARQAGQQHLLAISGRKQLAADVTDVLVARGDRAVLRSAARNPGANFSDDGFGTLVQRGERDPTLQQVVGLRADLPAHHFKLLIEKAAKDVKALLLHRVGRENIGALDKLVHAAAVDPRRGDAQRTPRLHGGRRRDRQRRGMRQAQRGDDRQPRPLGQVRGSRLRPVRR